MTSFAEQFNFSRRFEDEAMEVVDRHPFAFQRRRRRATSFEDMERATDAVLDPTAIAIRVRTHDYLKSYRYDFTIRSYSRGKATEFDKIMAGWCDAMFYGFSGPDNTPPCVRWTLINANGFRSAIKSGSVELPQERSNTDPRTGVFDGTRFYAFRMLDFLGLTPQVIINEYTHPAYVDESLIRLGQIARRKQRRLW